MVSVKGDVYAIHVCGSAGHCGRSMGTAVVCEGGGGYQKVSETQNPRELTSTNSDPRLSDPYVSHTHTRAHSLPVSLGVHTGIGWLGWASLRC